MLALGEECTASGSHCPNHNLVLLQDVRSWGKPLYIRLRRGLQADCVRECVSRVANPQGSASMKLRAAAHAVLRTVI